ncbi:dihydrofolate reductase family protein [Crocinitomix catalasitica]|uniref:dihydrofolate reductase family protein n=1 Tax=Crocinitomix catalasitica TaxID=184607 RepID=UPI000480571A|nr:dihydrofolate reductase family protein [Crocinitomix catalasitica]
MKRKNSVFIATSLDGYIADKNGNIDWLHSIPNPENNDMGYGAFIQNIDAIIMGRTTFETVCNFDMEWPYQIPVYVLSNTLTAIPDDLKNVIIVSGKLTDILAKTQTNGHNRLYIDGGKTIHSFLKEDLIDEMIITTIPTLLGGGTRLFSTLDAPLDFTCINSKIYLDKVVQNHFVRVK